MQNILHTYRLIRNSDSDSVDRSLLEKAALHYLCSPCDASEASVNGVGDIITQWLLSQVTFHDGKAYLDVPQYGYVLIKVMPNEDDREGELSILNYLERCYGFGYAPVLDTSVTSGTPLWSDWVNNLFRGVHDSHHFQWGVLEDLKGEVTLAHKAANQCYDWLASRGHDRRRANQARTALFFEVAGQAAAATWLGGYDKTRRNPYTGKVMTFSQKVILNASSIYDYHEGGD